MAAVAGDGDDSKDSIFSRTRERPRAEWPRSRNTCDIFRYLEKERTNSKKRERERRGFDNSFVGRGVGWSRRWRVLAAGTRGKFPGSRRVESRGGLGGSRTA